VFGVVCLAAWSPARISPESQTAISFGSARFQLSRRVAVTFGNRQACPAILPGQKLLVQPPHGTCRAALRVFRCHSRSGRAEKRIPTVSFPIGSPLPYPAQAKPTLSPWSRQCGPLCYFDLLHPAKLPRKNYRGLVALASRCQFCLRRIAPPACLPQRPKTSDRFGTNRAPIVGRSTRSLLPVHHDAPIRMRK